MSTQETYEQLQKKKKEKENKEFHVKWVMVD